MKAETIVGLIIAIVVVLVVTALATRDRGCEVDHDALYKQIEELEEQNTILKDEVDSQKNWRVKKASLEEKADSDPFIQAAKAAIADPNTPQVKRELFTHALAHRANLKRFRAHTVYYHPLEAGGAWKRWAGTATGTLVRPGVASCTVAHRRTWMGAWIWFRGHGLCKVEDNFPESDSKYMFDLAVWAKPGQSYEDWLWDPSRVLIARNRNVWTDAVLVKPVGGWDG